MLASEAITEVYRHLGGDRSARNRLNGAVSDSATSITFEFPLTGISAGAKVELPSGEVVYVWSTSGQTATVSRAEDGTTAAAQASGGVVRVAPRFLREEIRRALRDEMVSLVGEGLFQMAERALTFDRTSLTYDISAVEDSLLSIYGVRYEYGGRTYWLDGFRREEGVVRPYGHPPVDAATMFYRAPFVAFSGDSDDLEVVCGLSPSAQDLLCIGAAARLLLAKEALRVDVESQAHGRQAAEVPPQSVMGVVRQLHAWKRQRLASELMRLRERWPIRAR